MKKLSFLPTAALSLLLLASCADNDDREDMLEDRDEVVLTDNATASETVMDDDVYEEPATERVVEAPATTTDRAAEPRPTMDVNGEYAGLMPDEIRYRQSDGNVNWSSVPRSEWDGADNL